MAKRKPAPNAKKAADKKSKKAAGKKSKVPAERKSKEGTKNSINEDKQAVIYIPKQVYDRYYYEGSSKEERHPIIRAILDVAEKEDTKQGLRYVKILLKDFSIPPSDDNDDDDGGWDGKLCEDDPPQPPQ
ncbi:MAG TPA: hypothetical protein VL175_06130 [Pirellulales bacterium]|nr:hypothetical protein [Pirellulales bacterium]